MSGQRPDTGCIIPVWISTCLGLQLSESPGVCDVKYTGNDSSCSGGEGEIPQSA